MRCRQSIIGSQDGQRADPKSIIETSQTYPLFLLGSRTPSSLFRLLGIPLRLGTTQQLVLDLLPSTPLLDLGFPLTTSLIHHLVVFGSSFLGLGRFRVSGMSVRDGFQVSRVIVRVNPDTTRRVSSGVDVELVARLSRGMMA